MSKCAIAIGASAGGLEVLYKIVGGLPENLKAPVFVTLHLSPNAPSLLPKLISKHTRLTAVHPQEGEVFRDGVIYCAPPDYHLLVRRTRLSLGYGPKQNFHRPAIDALFVSVSEAFGPRAMGVLLSGNNDDGTYGLRVIKSRGGTTLVQDPREAAFPRMPASAVSTAGVDSLLPSSEIAARLVKLAEGFSKAKAMRKKAQLGKEAKEAGLIRSLSTGKPGGMASALTCPECGGALWEKKAAQASHFKCHTGHSFSEGSLRDAQVQGIEIDLWRLYRALEESTLLSHNLSTTAKRRGDKTRAKQLLNEARNFEKKAAILRQQFLERPLVPPRKR